MMNKHNPEMNMNMRYGMPPHQQQQPQQQQHPQMMQQSMQHR